ncbi:MAG: GGDEF domain-containing protein [Thermodesulfobacteriota bacterium]
MTDEKNLGDSLENITTSLRSFIELSLKKDDKTWGDWISSVAQDVQIKCWEEKDCQKTDCPAFKSECGRCWLIAGSLCGSGASLGPDGTTSCIDCEIYRDNVSRDPCSEIQEQIITLVHNLRTRQIEFKEMATQDSLTGLKNRRFFDMYMPHEIEKLRRNKGSMALLMIDVNDFKYINDAHGHVAGDQILAECAEVLGQSIRASDVLIRFGGDEFLIVMAEAAEKEANILLNRISEKLNDWNSRKTEYNIRLSLSIGYAILDGERELLAVIDEADRKMYEEKEKYKESGEN